jgi:hypothetical protein
MLPPRISDGAILKNTENLTGLEESLMDLHLSVNKLIKVIQENAITLERGEEVMNKLPLLDYYNDDLLRNIEKMRNCE